MGSIEDPKAVIVACDERAVGATRAVLVEGAGFAAVERYPELSQASSPLG